jgi:hypothetical protein
MRRLREPKPRTGIRVMNQLAGRVGMTVAVALPDAHPHCVQDELGLLTHRGGPADDAAGEGVHDERDVDGAGPGRDVREVRDPGAVRRVGDEVVVKTVRDPLRRQGRRWW